MWLLLINGSIYMLYGFPSRHFKRELLPIELAALKHDLTDALRLRLVHERGVYNAVQRLMYWMVLAAGALVVISGRSEEHTSELQSLMRISYAVFLFKKKTYTRTANRTPHQRIDHNITPSAAAHVHSNTTPPP